MLDPERSGYVGNVPKQRDGSDEHWANFNLLLHSQMHLFFIIILILLYYSIFHETLHVILQYLSYKLTFLFDPLE